MSQNLPEISSFDAHVGQTLQKAVLIDRYPRSRDLEDFPIGPAVAYRRGLRKRYPEFLRQMSQEQSFLMFLEESHLLAGNDPLFYFQSRSPDLVKPVAFLEIMGRQLIAKGGQSHVITPFLKGPHGLADTRHFRDEMEGLF